MNRALICHSLLKEKRNPALKCGENVINVQKYKAQKDKVTFDKKFLVLTLLLTLVGLIALTDASAPLAQRNFSDKFFFIKQQLVWAFFGIVSLFVISKVNYKLWEKIASLLFFASLFALLLVFVPSIG